MIYVQEYDYSINYFEEYWQEQVKGVYWFKVLLGGLSKDEDGFYCWYKGGQFNICYLVLDYYVVNGWVDQLVLVYDFLVMGKKEKYIYQQLLDEIVCFAGVLQVQGVEKGDWVIIYMFMIL